MFLIYTGLPGLIENPAKSDQANFPYWVYPFFYDYTSLKKMVYSHKQTG